jgi:hypothetical protein
MPAAGAAASGAPAWNLPFASPTDSEYGDVAADTDHPAPQQKQKADEWGEITVAQPKIWQYERVNSLLDGLLRDVEGVSLSDLTALNPNASNGAAVKFVQSMLEIGVKYDQGAAVSNAIAQQNYQTQQQFAASQLQANNTYLQQLYQQRNLVNGHLFAAMQQNTALQTQLANGDPTSAGYATLQASQTAASANVTNLQSQLTSINSQISTASSAPTTASPPTLTSTTAGAPPESANTFGSFLGSLPTGVAQSLSTQLQSPSYPATKQLDNFITLLYERLAHEVSALQDDLMRDPDNMAFLVQFDVGLYPSSRARNHVGVAEFTIKNCEGCKVYSVYPGQSSYNMTNYEGASKRYSFWGNIATLIGLGISADYRKQTDTLHGDLVQSVYMSGFQEGGELADGAGQLSEQRFGWYYGSAPFEPFVSPGMRSTFAIVTVPRHKPTEKCTNSFASQTASPKDKSNKADANPCLTQSSRADGPLQLSLNARTDWVRRDDPKYQKPHYLLPSDYVGQSSASAIPRKLRIVLPGTANLDDFSKAVKSEKNQLHVLAMEYNPVYYPKPATPAKPSGDASTTPPVPGTSTASATGNGAGASSVTVTGAGTATASSSGTAASTVSATATSPPSPPPTANAPSDPLTACPKNTCTGVLITLDQPIDPNLIVTVRGEPLKRVRDWRGRATSILPPAQSASDIPAGTAANATATTPQRAEYAPAPSLLEADLLAANTWLAVDSHRLLLNISRDLATDYDFPVIQITDPAKKTLVIPHQLDEGYTEIITNGFHMAPRTKDSLHKFACAHFFSAYSADGKEADCPASATQIRSGGPYPYQTFLPLFLEEPHVARLYAFLGETGNQLLIGFLPDSLNATGEKKKLDWLPSHNQVILEDRDLDFAWSLSCSPQGGELVCDLPQREIASAYRLIYDVCHDATAGNPSNCPALSNHWEDFPFVSTLQVWAEQYDAEDDSNNFYSAAPANVAIFPVEKVEKDVDDEKPATGFRPWYFERAYTDAVRVEACGFGNRLKKGTEAAILGQHIPADFRKFQFEKDPKDKTCVFFFVPTSALTHEEVVIQASVANNAPTTLTEPMSLSTALFRPYFGTPYVTPTTSGAYPYKTEQWTIEIPTGRVEYEDDFDVDLRKFRAVWRIGGATIKRFDEWPNIECTLAARCIDRPGWDAASKAGQLRLALTINKQDLARLQKKEIHLIRGADRITVARLPDLRALLFPSQLTLNAISATQFSLQGPNAGIIDAVTLQGPNGTVGPLTVGSVAELALVSLPKAANEGKTKAPTAGDATAQKDHRGPTITRVAVNGENLTIIGNYFDTTTAKNNTVTITWNNEKSTPTPTLKNKTLVVSLPSGLTSGKVVVKVRNVSSNTFDFAVHEESDSGAATDAVTYAVLPLVEIPSLVAGEKNYLPLEVTDQNGKPLTFTVPAKTEKKAAPVDPGGQTTTTSIVKNVKTTGSPTTPAAPAKKSGGNL